ncbi:MULTISPECIES: flagellin [unclassified Phenylobacterium]|uniref:flagellin n=1 Tax=unclassified Phenylobacterium TaxID=2640670 RepID=UPI00226445D5|nr:MULTISPECIES: flagellin [unclassified Phenylobacterium]MBS0489239.1 flagellin [Pseudomonadota bacterium]MCX7588064.1 flagellin [Phenylobacterium sp. 58.2.17]WGU39097.1 flagellin [Phenylobacterium sp. NIBR 498073]
MSMNSVNTNKGAMIALQNLNATNKDLGIVQNRINTGQKISTAKDNGAIWAIAQNQRAESASLNSVISSLQRGQSVADVAMSAGTAISDILVQMKEKVLAATEAGLSTASKAALSDEYKSLRDQIDTIANNATFDGVNLISTTSVNSASIKAIANADATATIDIDHVVLSKSNAKIAATLATLTNGVTSADVKEVEDAIQDVSSALSKLGTGAKALDTHMTNVMKLQDTLDAGVGNLVDADLAKESAKLQALQTKQQLGVQALSIANQSSSSLLGLFR